MNFDDMSKKCICVNCGKDITRSMKIYVYGFEGGPYCYDCAQIMPKKKRLISEQQKAKALYKEGLKVSEIAQRLKCSSRHVYDLLNRGKKK